jgi:hypothetical protein
MDTNGAAIKNSVRWLITAGTIDSGLSTFSAGNSENLAGNPSIPAAASLAFRYYLRN